MKRIHRAYVLLLALLLAVTAYSQAASGELIKARFTVDKQHVRIGEEVHFDATGSFAGKDKHLVAYFWEFNGMNRVGVNEHGDKVSHVFNHTGAYTVKLIIQNEKGERDQAVAFVEVLPDTDQGLSITDNFEGGKSGLLQSGKQDFTIRLEWGGQFYFRLDNCKGKPVSLRIDGYGKNRPQLPSVTPYSDDASFDAKFVLMANSDYINPDWQPLDKAKYTYDDASSSLVVEFTPTQQPLYLAWAAPFTMSRLEELIDKWEDRDEFSTEIVGLSVEGRPIYRIIVAANEGEWKDKKVIAVTGTQHAYEMAAGSVIEGMIETLLADNDSSRAMLRDCVFAFVPMVNPDGVFHGGYRYNMDDIDLNRNWNEIAINEWDSNIPEPEVASAQNFIENVVADAGHLDFFFDFHCLTAIADNLLMIRAEGDTIPAAVNEAQLRFNDLFDKRWVWRRTEDHTLSGGACGWAATKFAKQYGTKSFTPEHCLGWISRKDGKPVKATPRLFRELGADYIWVLREFFQSEKK